MDLTNCFEIYMHVIFLLITEFDIITMLASIESLNVRQRSN